MFCECLTGVFLIIHDPILKLLCESDGKACNFAFQTPSSTFCDVGSEEGRRSSSQDSLTAFSQLSAVKAAVCPGDGEAGGVIAFAQSHCFPVRNASCFMAIFSPHTFIGINLTRITCTACIMCHQGKRTSGFAAEGWCGHRSSRCKLTPEVSEAQRKHLSEADKHSCILPISTEALNI